MAIQALVMGFGGTGAQILTFLKELTVLKYGRQPNSVRFLLFDTIADWEPGRTVKILGGAAEEKLAVGREEGASLDPSLEYFFLSDHDPDLMKHVFEYLTPAGNPESLPHLKDWLHAPWLSLHVPKNQLNIREGAAQQRQVGRFAMFQNAERIVQQIEQEIRRLRESSERGVVNVWIIGSAAGGTGAGCLLDAAFLTRRAAGNTPVSITGVIVLPEVYADKEGISQGRAYSLFRELDRFQEQGCGVPDRFVDGKLVSSRVRYDARKRLESTVGSRLFDNLFYVGDRCTRDSERTSFFTSVANSIDPFLDEEAGPPLLQNAVNSYAAASSFGAARLYIPAETYADIFAWEEVERYLEGAAAPRATETVLDLRYGSAQDRRSEGEAKVVNLLPLFHSVLDLSQRKEDQLQGFARNLSARSIVKEWYGFGGGAVAGLSLTPSEQQVALLTCVNPYISWMEDDADRVPGVQRTLKTFQENKSAKGPKEDKTLSRDRFADELDRLTKSYCSREAGDRSFEKGRRLVIEKLSSLLRSRVDELVLNELQQKPQLGPDPEALNQGTVMTRLFQSFKEVLADGGTLQRIDATVSRFLETMQGEETKRQGEAVKAVKDLREWAAAGWFGSSVEEPQQAAREASAEYIAAYQKFRLLQDMQKLVREVRGRFEEWTALMKRMFDGLVLGVEHSGFAETRKQLRRLGGRLGRLAENPTALISCADRNPPDLDMQGFRKVLQQECVLVDGRTRLAEEALSGSRWQVALDAHGRPQIHLVIRSEGGGERKYGTDTVTIMHRDLHDRFRVQIDGRMDQHDIFDYLRHAQQPSYDVNPDRIAQLLNAAAEVLINAPSAELCTLIYRDPVDNDKRNLAQAISRSVSRGLGNKDLAESHHSDKFSLTLLKIRKPNLDSIHDILQCRDDYLQWQQASKNGHQEHDEQLYRAQVYHPFRPELEAWYIERRHFLLSNRGMQQEDHIPPRIVRLLEDPAMMQAFVHCVATGTVEKVDGNWVWHDLVNSRDVILTERDVEAKADLVRAAVVFVLQQREGRRQGLIPVRLDDARRSAVQAAQAQGRSRDDLLKEFVATRLDTFLDSHFPLGDEEETHRRERSSLRMLFEFYTHAETLTQLSQRLDLNYRA